MFCCSWRTPWLWSYHLKIAVAVNLVRFIKNIFCCYVVQAVDMLITLFVRTTRCDFNCIDGECIAHMYHYTPCGSYTISNDVRSQLKQMYNVTKCFFQLLGNVSMIYGKLRVLTMLEPYKKLFCLHNENQIIFPFKALSSERYWKYIRSSHCQ
jgi:hypothetical protein